MDLLPVSATNAVREYPLRPSGSQICPHLCSQPGQQARCNSHSLASPYFTKLLSHSNPPPSRFSVGVQGLTMLPLPSGPHHSSSPSSSTSCIYTIPCSLHSGCIIYILSFMGSLFTSRWFHKQIARLQSMRAGLTPTRATITPSLAV
jgi:hypothetical protein